MTAEHETEKTRPDPVEEAGETTAADSTPTPSEARPVGAGTTADVEGEGEPPRPA
ncbi:MAG TPA: hypothetical protein VF659_15635 [Pyrinomonadaceae bacterium]|jgi:hypothetical protein